MSSQLFGLIVVAAILLTALLLLLVSGVIKYIPNDPDPVIGDVFDYTGDHYQQQNSQQSRYNYDNPK